MHSLCTFRVFVCIGNRSMEICDFNPMTEVCFYTSCTMTKSLPTSALLSVSSLSRNADEKRAEQWHSRIDAWHGDRRRAMELYCGGCWSVVRSITERKAGDGFRSFVVSAGYGLVSTEAFLAPYAATFALGQEDSVAVEKGKVGPIENVAWWNQLCNWRPVGVTGVRSIYAAVKKWPHRVHLFALSPYYLDAISEDLARARQELANPQNLIVISAGKKRHGELNSNVLSAPAHLQTLLGGSLVSLNVRLAAKVFNSIPAAQLCLDEVREFMASLSAQARPRDIPKRALMTDSEVVRFIKKSSKSTDARSYTTLLRSLRKSGRACEMKRFRELFRKSIT